jgi:hypothetical protein
LSTNLLASILSRYDSTDKSTDRSTAGRDGPNPNYLGYRKHSTA